MANMMGKRHAEGLLHFGCSQCNSRTSRLSAKHTGRRREDREWRAEVTQEVPAALEDAVYDDAYRHLVETLPYDEADREARRYAYGY